MDIESGVAGRGHCQLHPQNGKFLVDDVIAEMVHSQGIRAPKRRAHRRSRGAGARECTKGSRCHTSGRPQRKATRNAQRAGGITCDGGDGLRNGRYDSSLHSKEEVQRGQLLDMED